MAARITDAFESAASSCTSDAELRSLLEDVTRALGFRYFALLHHASLLDGGSGFIRIDNYPAAWEEELRAEGLVGHDPVHLASARTNVGFAWEELGSLVPLTGRHRRMLERGARHGLGAGYTVPVNVPGEPCGSCTFAVAAGRDLPWQRLASAERIGAHGFAAARRYHSLPAPASPPRLSRRELQCLRLVARGKTDPEIGLVLGISEETARQYVKAVRAQWDVISRTQAVVHGLKDCVISFDEALG